MNEKDKFKFLEEIHQSQQNYFATGATKDIQVRIELLEKLSAILHSHQSEIQLALNQDLRKSKFEAHGTEVAAVLQEIKLFIKKIPSWAKAKSQKNSMLTFPARAYVYNQPYGNVLNIAPWNYPFLLAIMPTVGALAAGNTCLIKPSEISHHTSALITDLINSNFDRKYLHAIVGDAQVSEKLLDLKWDYIFFTGSPKVGKIIYQKAATHLTPVTLELGGKSPCIINADANLKLSAKRIVWGKFTNVGQTCVAPDYLVIHQSIKENFLQLLKTTISEFYGQNPQTSADYGRIVSKNHWNRLHQLALEQDAQIHTTNFDQADNYIAPIIFDNCNLQSPLMREEIFGPLLPCLTFSTDHDLKKILDSHKNPLACYIFTQNKKFAENIIENFSFGGGCINDVLMHLANHNLPFGGVGSSGIGNYHGKRSFDTFSHQKAVLEQSGWLDFASFKYPPFNEIKFSILKFLTKYL